MIREIVKYPDKRLRTKSIEVLDINEESVQTLIKDMIETMCANKGVGLAAIQVGVPLRIIVACHGSAINTIINPSALELRGKPEYVTEGCLSFPGVFEKVKRHPIASVKCFNRTGIAEIVDTSQMGPHGPLLAQIIQHEIEHLDGMVFLDKMGITKKEMVLKKLAKRGIY